MARTNHAPAGKYNTPAQIQAPVTAWVDNSQGGNANAGQWTTVRSPMIHLYSPGSAGGARRAYQYGQLYPTANHWAEMRYAREVAIDATMSLLVDGRHFQILGAIDRDLEHVETILALVEYQAKGTATS